MKKAALLLLALFIAIEAGTTTAPREQLSRLFVSCLIASTDTSHHSPAWINRNPGNLVDFRTGKYRKFYSFEQGLAALRRQVVLYQSGRSMWADSVTSFERYGRIYAGSERYGKRLRRLCGGAGCIGAVNADTLVKYHVLLEQRDLFNSLYN